MVQFKIDCNEYYSRILALGPKGHCTSCFKTVMCISCRRNVDVHKWGAGPMWIGGGAKNRIFLWTSLVDDRNVCYIHLQHCLILTDAFDMCMRFISQAQQFVDPSVNTHGKLIFMP